MLNYLASTFRLHIQSTITDGIIISGCSTFMDHYCCVVRMYNVHSWTRRNCNEIYIINVSVRTAFHLNIQHLFEFAKKKGLANKS